VPRRNLNAAIAAAVVVIVVVVVAGYFAFSGSSGSTVTTVTDYVGGVTTSAPQDFAAQAEGTFAKHNLKVKFVTLSGTSQAVQAVASDQSGLAFTQGDILDEMLIADKGTGAPALIGISANEPLNPVAVIYLQNHGITKPSDLVGKKIGVPTGSLSEQYLDVWLQKEGISTSQVTIQNIGFSALNAALLQKQVDAIAEFARGIASLDVAAPQQGDSIGSFLFGDYNMPSPLGAVVVQKSLLDKHPDVAKAIAEATTESLYFCATQPNKCITDFVNQNQGRDFNQSLAEWQVALKAQYGIDTKTVASKPPLTLGWFDPQLVANTLPQLKTLFGVTGTYDPTSLYTNQFVQQP
jgi:NitT/TauT family transport system substrate-binding protein